MPQISIFYLRPHEHKWDPLSGRTYSKLSKQMSHKKETNVMRKDDTIYIANSVKLDSLESKIIKYSLIDRHNIKHEMIIFKYSRPRIINLFSHHR